MKTWYNSRLMLGLLAASLLFAAPAAQSGMFQYTDDSGVLHYVDSESKIPEKYRRAATAHQPKGTAIRTVPEPAAAPETGQQSLNDLAGSAVSGDAIPVRSAPVDPQAPSPSARPNSPDFWKRRRHLLEEKIRNLKDDCEFWRKTPTAHLGDPSAASVVSRERGLKQCGELARARQDLDMLASEVRKQGGSPAWLSD